MPAYQLVRGPVGPPSAPITLDDDQRLVVEHRGGPLLVLAGPGTGKTTTLVAAVAARVADRARPLRPDQVLVLTFSRKAAAELRDRIAARLDRTTAEPAAWTFHAFAYALVRAYSGPGRRAPPPRLLTGPEQELAVRELITGSVAGGRVRWPAALTSSVGTLGFAVEVRAVLARARELGLDPDDLRTVARRADRADWVAVADLQADYLDVLDARDALDYAELMHRAAVLAEGPEVQARLRARFGAVFVDEFQDTDPAQERLLRALAGDGRDLVVVGDPDQSIYGFRGADVANILEFPARFPRRDGRDAPVLTLGCSRRAGESLLAASRSLAARMGLRGLPGDKVRAHRALRPAPGGWPGEVTVSTYPSAGAELEAVADLLRRAHLEDGQAWGCMAVLVRSGVRSIPLVRRVLGAAGVPVEVAGDELPLAREPAVAPLLLALRCVADPGQLTAERARVLLLSPLGGADPPGLRRLGRALRSEERAGSTTPGGPRPVPRPSDELIAAAVAEPVRLLTHDERLAGSALRLGELLGSVGQLLDGGAEPDEALWALWDATGWPRRLARQAEAGGAAGRSADRDLDAVCQLFEVAGRAGERHGRAGALDLLAELEAQQIPADTLAERGIRGDAVRVLTAHRSKGLEWDLVVVPGVQEGVWPDLRRRGSLLEPDRLGPDRLDEPASPTATLAEERRLFYVAVTRARRRLVVTAVDSAEDDGERPSRFLEELGVPVEQVLRRPARRLSLPGLVAELRATALDPALSAGLPAAAVARLGALAAARDGDGRALVPAASPDRWWGLAEVSVAEAPLHEATAAVALSGSSLAGIEGCPLRWFLEHEVHADSPRSVAVGFGSVVHALAHEVAAGRLPADVDVLLDRLDRVWRELAFEARWQSDAEREAARAALTRFLAWHRSDRGRTFVASEHEFRVEVPTAAGRAVLRGSMDRVEVDAAGRVHVVDYKTGRTLPKAGEVTNHPQLGVYQRVLADGALDSIPRFAAARPEAGGAELVQLRHSDRSGGPKVQDQPSPVVGPDGGTWVDEMLARAVQRVLTEDFRPQPNERCDRCPFRRACPARPEGQQVVP